MAGSADGTTTTARKKHRKPRGRGLRTTTGCTVCRQRHLKCGEEKPRCENCARGGRDCVYGSTRANTRPSSSHNLNISEQGNDTSTADDTEFQATASNADDTFDLEPEITADNDNVNDNDDYQATVAGATAVYSPLSTLSSTASQGPETGPLRWFSLVATDFQNNQQASGAFTSIFEHTGEGEALSRTGTSLARNFSHSAATASDGLNFRVTSRYQLSPRTAQDELPSLYAEVTLRSNEIPILQNFCNRIAEWLDVLDPMRHFASVLPQLAMRNEGLMKAMLALSARHMSLQQSGTDQPLVSQTLAIQYYHDTLQYLHNAMKYPEFLKSIEVNATSLILSTYEMVDGMGRGWIRHLKGVFWIQRSQNTSAESGGMKAAIWWAWLRQDTWAALRENRKVLTIHNWTVSICDLDFWHHANFVSFLFALCVSYMSEEEVQTEATRLQERVDRANYLFSSLEEWYSYLPVNFKAIPLALPSFAEHTQFRPVWINPPSFGIVLQTYHASRVILLSHAPAIGGFREFSIRNKQLSEAIDTVCGIAMTIKDGGSSFISTSCLWACGLCSQDDARREAISNLIREHKNITGWPVTDLGEELRQEWTKWN